MVARSHRRCIVWHIPPGLIGFLERRSRGRFLGPLMAPDIRSSLRVSGSGLNGKNLADIHSLEPGRVQSVFLDMAFKI